MFEWFRSNMEELRVKDRNLGGQLVDKVRVRFETVEQVLDGEVMELFEQIKRLKENQLMRGTNLSSQSQFNKLDKPMNEHEKFKEEEMKKLHEEIAPSISSFLPF